MKTHPILSSLAVTQILVFALNAQTVQWAQKGISPGYEYGNAITTDDSGNVYVAGQIEYTTDFGTISLASHGIHDFFAGKFGPDGSIKWLRDAGGTGGDVGYGVGVDALHNTYCTGEMEKTAYFTPTDSLTAVASNDIVVIKYSVSGNFLWAKSFGSPGNDKGMAMAVSPAGDVYITGYYSSGIDFDNVHLSHIGVGDVYILKLDANGVVQWAKKGGGTDTDHGHGIAYNSNGDVYVAGTFTNSATFSGTTIASNHNIRSAFLVKYNSSGGFQWVEMGGNCCDTTELNCVAVDENGFIYTAGFFNSNTTYGGINLTSAGSSDIIIAKYDPSGNVVWAKRAGGPYEDAANGISVDTINHIIYVTGQIDDHGFFDSHYIGAAGNRDVFIAAYDENGNCLWVKPNGGVQRDIGYAIAATDVPAR